MEGRCSPFGGSSQGGIEELEPRAPAIGHNDPVVCEAEGRCHLVERVLALRIDPAECELGVLANSPGGELGAGCGVLGDLDAVLVAQVQDDGVADREAGRSPVSRRAGTEQDRYTQQSGFPHGLSTLSIAKTLTYSTSISSVTTRWSRSPRT